MFTNLTFLVIFFVPLVSVSLSDVHKFKEGNRIFTGQFYKELLKEQNGNFIISPFSAATVLALTQSGAKDETAKEIRTTLHLPEDTEKAFESITKQLKAKEEYSLQTANKIFVKKNLNLHEDFQKVAEDVYKSGLETVDFQHPDNAALVINQFVEENTAHKIKNLIDPASLDPLTVAILVNAVHFKAEWFRVFFTQKGKFYSPNAVEVEMMTMDDLELNFYHSKELKAKFLEIPFKGENASMTFVLPDAVDGLEDLEKEVEKVFTIPLNYTEENVNFFIPAFRIESKTIMNSILKNLGMKKSFDISQADFSGAVGEKGDFYISDVIQKAFIQLDENGVEVAVATEDAWVYYSLSSPAKTFIADHPFLFYITVKDVIVFAGRFVTPESSLN